MVRLPRGNGRGGGTPGGGAGGRAEPSRAGPAAGGSPRLRKVSGALVAGGGGRAFSWRTPRLGLTWASGVRLTRVGVPGGAAWDQFALMKNPRVEVWGSGTPAPPALCGERLRFFIWLIRLAVWPSVVIVRVKGGSAEAASHSWLRLGLGRGAGAVISVRESAGLARSGCSVRCPSWQNGDTWLPGAL